MRIIDGKQLAASTRANIKAKHEALLEELQTSHLRWVGRRPSELTPHLAIIMVGDNPASETYVRNKKRALDEVGFRYSEFLFDSNVEEKTLIQQINILNQSPAYHGIFVQFPLPKHLNEHRISNAIAKQKDVDGFHEENVADLRHHAIVKGKSHIPCTVVGCLALIQEGMKQLGWDESQTGRHVVIIGRSQIVGKPLAQLLMNLNYTVTVVHSKTPPQTAKAVCQQADIIVSAAGVPNVVTADMVKPGAIVIDVGINFVEINGKRKMVGDVDFESVKEIAGAITPVPGGVGPMTVAYLVSNLFDAFLVASDLDEPSL